jgi:protein TonB
MQTNAIYKLAGACMISACCVFGMVACNNDNGYARSDADSAKSAAMPADSPANVATDAAATSAKTEKIPAKKRKTLVTMPQGSNGQMVKDKEGVYNNAEVMPQFPGGNEGLSSYVSDHVQYSQSAIDANTEGTVKVSFVVDENGKVMDAHVVGEQKIGNGLDEEAVKAVSNMPSWKPGKVKGKNVKTRLELPISFQLEA